MGPFTCVFWVYSQTHGPESLWYPRGNKNHSLAMGQSIRCLHLPSPRAVNQTTTKAKPRCASGGSQVQGPGGLSGEGPRTLHGPGRRKLRKEFSRLPLREGMCTEEPRRNRKQVAKRARPAATEREKTKKGKGPTADVDWWHCAVSFGLGANLCRRSRDCPSNSVLLMVLRSSPLDSGRHQARHVLPTLHRSQQPSSAVLPQ